jgi:threonine/homoserine/homoserine lactone efflux protein
MTTKEEMNTNQATTETERRKVLLSTLWLFAMLTYTYGDVVTLMDPVKHGSIELTETFLLGGSIFMMIPISMVLLSRILKYRANRWANIIAGTIMTIALTLTLFVAVPTLYYAFFSVIEIACTAVIVWYAWKWRNPEGSPINIAIAQAKSA